ncbi:PREDICTED: glucan endo-1,3-beta-glucosidase 5-like [Brassica oleracea var. oleracea]|uniref:glucan endo-1,3-beta-D-glucosidase n=2 Tax=Brassica oleracea TaxID=3712 RepID=A0A0D3BM20_BRAOL|nr:PREDICTED: glucan endo-1,3-beta-glucosidase 5-like [Brassica oleracea var. oleracea]VDD00623.1 unnamed protein product [Brassica oleracea]
MNWGSQASHPLPPATVVRLLRVNGIQKVKLFEADSEILRAISRSGIQVMVGIPNDLLAPIAGSVAVAERWVSQNVSAHVSSSGVDISLCLNVAVGNEPFLKSFNGTFEGITLIVITLIAPVGELQFIVNETNWEARTVIVHIIGNVISKSYKMVEATLTAIPRGDMTSSGVAWTVVFEKIGLDVQDREQIVGTLENLIEKIDRNLYPEPCPP